MMQSASEQACAQDALKAAVQAEKQVGPQAVMQFGPLAEMQSEKPGGRWLQGLG